MARAIKTREVTRVEVIGSKMQNNRLFAIYNVSNVEVHLQDEGRTLKVFLKDTTQ